MWQDKYIGPFVQNLTWIAMKAVGVIVPASVMIE